MGLILSCAGVFNAIGVIVNSIPFAVRLCIFASAGFFLFVGLLKNL